MLVPEAEREGVVAAVEAQIVREFAGKVAGGRRTDEAGRDGAARSFTAVSPPRQRDGYVEIVETTYELGQDAKDSSGADRSRSAASPDSGAHRRRSGGM